MAQDILIVDDEEDIRMLVAAILEDEGFETRQAWDSDSALAAIDERLPGLVIQDIWLQDSPLDGLGILKEIQKAHPALPFVMISGHGTISTAVQAIRDGAYDFIEKPFQTDQLLLTLGRALEASRLKRENEELRLRATGIEDLTGSSSAINAVRQTIERVGPTGSRVLIIGPAGAGKELVARQIHAKSKRENGPFVILNCAAMHPDRMEIELFGAEKGADGEPRKVGTFERAHGGTLLLDEVADMPLETQGKIVRALQDQTFERVGGSTRVKVDVRVIATTNRDLEAEIAEGRFREDLFYRLNVVPVRMPSLRERRDDIPALVDYFLDRAATASGMGRRTMGADALAVLQSYEWPGNIRQLRNVIDWMLIMAPGDVDGPMTADMLPPELRGATPDSLKMDRSAEIMSLPLREARETFEREYLLAQIERFGGNVSRTATFVGMERSALHRKLKSLGVTSDDGKNNVKG